MKQFTETNKVTYNLMSFTGFKALLIFSMLSEGPKSYEEISSAIKNNQYLREKISIDTLRVYINSLKRIGCEIKRIKGDDKISRYFITTNPFELKISTEQANSIIKIYKNLVKNMDIQDILYMDSFFNKISKYIENTEFINIVKNISMLKGIDKILLENLIDCCNKNACVTVRYRSPQSGEKNIKIQTKKIEINNGKIYLYGYGYDYKECTSFPVSRIKEIIEIKNTDSAEVKPFVVRYFVNKDKYNPKDDEKIIQINNDKLLIEISITNKFYLKQRLLEYGPAAKIISPDSFKNEYIELLKTMKAGYCNE